ncbi:MAG: GAF domain-containing protein [Polyangiales bacterium]
MPSSERAPNPRDDSATDLSILSEQLRRQREENDHLVEALTAAQKKYEELRDQFAIVEQQSSTMASLYAAAHRLHEAKDRDDVLAAVQEIITNLIGSEQMGVFQLSPGGQALSLVDSMGIVKDRYLSIPLGTGVIGRAVASGETYVSSRDDLQKADEGDVCVCIPLKSEDHVTGAIAIFRLLPQKLAVEPTDLELFEFLSTHVSHALECATMFSKNRHTLRPKP